MSGGIFFIAARSGIITWTAVVRLLYLSAVLGFVSVRSALPVVLLLSSLLFSLLAWFERRVPGPSAQQKRYQAMHRKEQQLLK